MPLTDRNIVITPSGPLGAGSTEATIRFTGANPTNGLVGTSTSASTFIRVLDDGSISFEGSTGQLNAITNSVSGDIFLVNDKSGIPSIEIEDNGSIFIAKYQGRVFLGNNTASTNTTTGALNVLGGVGISGNLNIGGSFAMNANLGVGGAGAYVTGLLPIAHRETLRVIVGRGGTPSSVGCGVGDPVAVCGRARGIGYVQDSWGGGGGCEGGGRSAIQRFLSGSWVEVATAGDRKSVV
jgi:hypothetical protein